MLRTFLARNERVARRCGLTPQRFVLLLMIKAANESGEDLSFGDVASRLDLSRSGVTELVRRAEHVGLVRRRSSPVDRRVVYLETTPEGDARLVCALEAPDARRALTDVLQALRRLYPNNERAFETSGDGDAT